MELVRNGLLIGSAAIAGAVNAVAGGGTLISFPAAIAWGLPSTVANATNAVAMAPGSFASAWAYRREIAAERRLVRLLSVPAVLGGITGAAILRHTSERLFDAVVPWLVLGATLMILFQGVIVKRLRGAATPASPDGSGAPSSRRHAVIAVLSQFLVGIYGGYFGAAMGIVTLAYLSLVSSADIQRRNAVKNLVSALVNVVASIYFVVAGLVSVRGAILMTGGAVAGGFIGGRLARRASPRLVRALVVAIGLSLSALLAWRSYMRPPAG
jgi:uncharacterized membrane protein YfcA